jgi:hypothetical protein
MEDKEKTQPTQNVEFIESRKAMGVNIRNPGK